MCRIPRGFERYVPVVYNQRNKFGLNDLRATSAIVELEVLVILSTYEQTLVCSFLFYDEKEPLLLVVRGGGWKNYTPDLGTRTGRFISWHWGDLPFGSRDRQKSAAILRELRISNRGSGNWSKVFCVALSTPHY